MNETIVQTGKGRNIEDTATARLAPPYAKLLIASGSQARFHCPPRQGCRAWLVVVAQTSMVKALVLDGTKRECEKPVLPGLGVERKCWKGPETRVGVLQHAMEMSGWCRRIARTGEHSPYEYSLST